MCAVFVEADSGLVSGFS